MLEHFIASVPVEHLASAEEHRELNFVALFKKFASVIEFNLKVACISFGSEPYLLQRCIVVLAFLMSFTNFAFLLILPLAVIHYPTYRWVTGRGYFHKVKADLACPVEGFIFWYDTHLIICLVNEPNCFGPNSSIYL